MIGDAGAAGSGGSGEGTGRRVPLGELLVQAKVITSEQLAEVLATPREPGKKIGQILIERGLLTEAQLTQTLGLQLSVPWVSLYHIDFSRQLLNRVSRELAERYCLIPIFVRHVKGQGETLYVAMDDPTHDGALGEVAKQAGLPTKPMIASATDIRSAIRVYYGESEPRQAVVAAVPIAREAPAPPRESKPAVPPVPPARRAASQPPPPLPARAKPSPEIAVATPSPTGAAVAPPAPSEPHASEEGTPSGAAESSAEGDKAQARRRGAKMLALTLLDGTTINLPARPSRKEAFASQDGLTARDFVSALRATSHGADPTEVLGEKPQWEPVVAALLSILLRKGLIADWEFVEELRKI